MENSLHYKLRICHTNCQKSIVIDLKSKTDLRPGEPKILEFLAEHEPCEQKEMCIRDRLYRIQEAASAMRQP